MPRASSRKGTINSTASGNSSTVDLFRAAFGKTASKELERIDQLFFAYGNSSGMIDPEGIESLCIDLEVDHTDVRILILAWKMQAEKQGYFTLDEWRTGLKLLRSDTILKLRKALQDLEKDVFVMVRKPSNFSDFYAYAFRYCLTEERQKSIDIESICLLLGLVVLGSQFHPQVDALTRCSLITRSLTWISVWGSIGSAMVSFPDISNYDPDHAWPLILDNFVEWLRSKREKASCHLV